MMTTSQSQKWEHEKADAERFEKFMGEKVSAMATSISLELEEVLDILQNIHVEMVGELRTAVEALEGTQRALQRVDSAKLSREIERLIEAVSYATDLDTEEITDIFSGKPGASLSDVSLRLHERSREYRFTHS